MNDKKHIVAIKYDDGTMIYLRLRHSGRRFCLTAEEGEACTFSTSAQLAFAQGEIVRIARGTLSTLRERSSTRLAPLEAGITRLP